MPDESELKIGDIVTCNIFRIGLTKEQYLNVLNLVSRNKEDEIKKIKGSSSIMRVPKFTGEVIEVKTFLKNNLIVTVSNGSDKIMLLSTYWTKIKEKGTN